MIENPAGGIQNFRTQSDRGKCGGHGTAGFPRIGLSVRHHEFLPEAVKAGEEVNIKFTWKGQWQFGAFLTAESMLVQVSAQLRFELWG